MVHQDKITEGNVRQKYMEIMRKLHPGKTIPGGTDHFQEEATQLFQPLNNAQAYLLHD